MTNTHKLVVAVIGGSMLAGVVMPYVPIKFGDPTIAMAANVALSTAAIVITYRLLGGAA